MAQNIMKTSGRGSFFLWLVAGAGGRPVGAVDVCAGGRVDYGGFVAVEAGLGGLWGAL
jgi:hypothetical protein